MEARKDQSLLQTIAPLLNDVMFTEEQRKLLRWHLDVIFGGDWACPLDQLSTMALDIGPLAYEGGDMVFPKGFGEIPNRMAEGVDIRYNEWVKQIDWRHKNKIKVTSARGHVYKASQLLITVSIG